jgi:hypothetical protein
MAAAIIPLIPSIVAGAPALINTLVSVIGGLVHKHEKASPAPGASKKAAAMSDFVNIAAPIVALLVKMETGKTVDEAALASAASGLIDNIVALNNALGVFQTTAPTAPK